MLRRERRLLWRLGKSVSPNWSDFKVGGIQVFRELPELMFWNAPWEVTGHVFSDCRQLYNEWAGWPLGRVIRKRASAARNYTTGVCRLCWDKWTEGMR